MKKFLTWFSLGAILVCCVLAALSMGKLSPTYDPSQVTVPVYELQQNLAKSHSVNDVTSIVFDFRGYDTMGEAFILITAVAGSAVILSGAKKKEEKEEAEKDE